MFGKKQQKEESSLSLKDYISNVVAEIGEGAYLANEALQENGHGSVYLDNLTTRGQDLIHVGLLKSDTQDEKSKPIIAVQFDVTVAVQDGSSHSSQTKAGASAKVLSVINFDGSIDAGSSSTNQTNSTQKLKFTIPIALELGNTPNKALKADS
ncbi:hypothetical protein A9264_04880 [Vibrio sp. UCD-FRSSP16_10]|uniref:hypothetical protein n=1 Tax=unclassified Vibrio TaxID=2614977 RepID=UPI000802395A|nr:MULTISPECIES: hypothetical protein [unclassified Vibrio]OBT08571.1 hypothetical protein A9260_07120 [Vibrio sp. UCD-FRSSP16_30]OBT18101.1 hypothetical protein A9264_04880 [Vibrio sp. UCD-FRSSP16_10]